MDTQLESQNGDIIVDQEKNSSDEDEELLNSFEKSQLQNITKRSNNRNTNGFFSSDSPLSDVCMDDRDLLNGNQDLKSNALTLQNLPSETSSGSRLDSQSNAVSHSGSHPSNVIGSTVLHSPVKSIPNDVSDFFDSQDVIDKDDVPTDDDLLEELENEVLSIVRDSVSSDIDTKESEDLKKKYVALQRHLEHTVAERRHLEVENLRLEQKLELLEKSNYMECQQV